VARFGGIRISTAAAVPPLRRDTEDITDHALVARVRAGDDRAFECLYERYQRRICAYVQGMVHDHARAEDVCQDVFMSALRRMRETDRPIAFKPWIYEIAKNACIDQFRRSRRAEVVSMDADDGLGSADYGKLVTRDATPEVAVENKQQLDHLCGAFGGLSETHHEILVMRELEGLSYREIGERLGMTRPAVESTLFRARRRLSEEYDDLVSGERCRRVQSIIAAAAQGSLGARDRKRLARHVSYCQPCLRQARRSGVEHEDLVRTPLRQKIASLLPLPLFLKRRFGGNDSVAGAADAPALAAWSTYAGAVDPNLVSSWGKAVATAATIAVAGVGAGAATKPAEDARAALGGSVLESLRGDDGGDRRAAAGGTAAAPAPVPIARQAGWRVPQPGGASISRERGGDPAPASAGGERSTAGGRESGGSGEARRDREKRGGGDAGSRGGGDDGSSTSAPLGTGGAGSTATRATGEATRTGSGPISDVISRVTGGGGSTSPPSTSDGGSATISVPRVPLPGTAPSTDAPARTDAGGTVDQVVEDVEETVTDTVGGVTDVGEGILGGK
jgi:RNA polymerase sigma factor (sigma-70 family)